MWAPPSLCHSFFAQDTVTNRQNTSATSDIHAYLRFTSSDFRRLWTTIYTDKVHDDVCETAEVLPAVIRSSV